MQTRLLDANSPAEIQTAADLLTANEVVGLPTETVYGLAANALSKEAVARIFEAKRRPADNPLIVHVTGPSRAFELTDNVTSEVAKIACKLMSVFWPGPLTIILPKSKIVPDIVTAGRPDVGLRCPAHRAFQAVLEVCGFPLAAPSANPAGKPSPTTAAHVLKELNGRIPAVLDGGAALVGVESTVISLTGRSPRLLRPGGVTVEELEKAVGEVIIDPAISAQLAADVAPAAPGMKYRHYSPTTPLEIFPGTPTQALDYLTAHKEEGIGVLGFSEDAKTFRSYPFVSYGPRAVASEQARQLFAALRAVDELGVDRVIAFAPPYQGGVFLAVDNRLRKAAGFSQTRIS